MEVAPIFKQIKQIGVRVADDGLLEPGRVAAPSRRRTSS